MGKPHEIKVSDAIAGLREELSIAMERGASEDIRFRIKGLSLELTAKVEWSADARAKASWMIFSGETGVKRDDLTTQTLKIELEVVASHTENPMISRDEE